MNRLDRLRALALALAHFIIVMVFLRAGIEWGIVDSVAAGIFHVLTCPGCVVYFLLEQDALASLLLAYPLNSALWGFGLMALWRRVARAERTGKPE